MLKKDPIEGMLWWRVSLHPDGSIASCEKVDAAAPGGTNRLVTYVQATQKTDAITNALAWRTAYLAKKALAQKERKDRRARAPERRQAYLRILPCTCLTGRCACGRAARQGELARMPNPPKTLAPADWARYNEAWAAWPLESKGTNQNDRPESNHV